MDFIHSLHERIENGEVIEEEEEVEQKVPDCGILLPVDAGQEAQEPKNKVVYKGLALVIERLFNECLSENLEETEGLGGDNMSAIIVKFKQ